MDKGPLDTLWAGQQPSTPAKQITKAETTAPQTDVTLSTETTQKPIEVAKPIENPVNSANDGGDVRQQCFDTDCKAKSTESKGGSLVKGVVDAPSVPVVERMDREELAGKVASTE